LLLLVGAGVVFLMLRTGDTPPAPATVTKPEPPPPVAERVNPMAQPELILDEPKDAGQPVEAATEKPKNTAPREARGDWDCEGDLSRSALKSVIDNNRPQVRACYERRLKMNNALAGDLTLKIKVGSSGQISAAAVNGSLKDSEVFSCVKALAQKWSFPPPTGGTCAVVQVPFQFSPKL
jgi:TonB family protein